MRGCLTVFLALLLLIVAPLSLLAFNAQSALLSPATYREALREEVLRPALIETLSAGMTEGAPQEAIQPEQVQQLLEGLIPPGWIGEQIDRNIEALFQWIDSEDAAPDLRIDLRPIKANLPQSITSLVVAEWEKIPLCAKGELPDLSGDLPTCRTPEMSIEEILAPAWESIPVCGAGEWPPADPAAYPGCRPEGVSPQEFLGNWWSALPECGPEIEEPPGWSEEAPPSCRQPGRSLERMLALADPLSGEAIASGFPDEYTLADVEGNAGEEGPLESLRALRGVARAGRLGSYTGLGLSSLLLVLIALASAVSAKALFGRVGAVLLVVGLVSLGIAASLAGLAGGLSNLVIPPDAGPGALASVASAVLGQLMEAIANPFLIESLLIAGVGVFLLIVRFVLGRRTSQPAT